MAGMGGEKRCHCSEEMQPGDAPVVLMLTSLDVENEREQVPKRHETGRASGNIGDSFGLDRVDEKEQRGPEWDVLRVFRHGSSENPVDEETGAEVKQQIQQMVAGRAVSIERLVEKECGVQQRPDHVIEMADKRLPSGEMGVDENREEVVILKGAVKGTGVSSHGKRDENGGDEPGANHEAIHGVVILHRALMV